MRRGFVRGLPSMPCVVGLTLDREAANVVTALSTKVLDVAEAKGVHVSSTPPHITLAIAEYADERSVGRLIDQVASESAPLQVTFDSIGVFSGPDYVLYLAPVVTHDLLSFHTKLHRELEPYSKDQSPYYLPGRWVPHCTIASEISQTALPSMVAACVDVKLPLVARLTDIALVKTINDEVGSDLLHDELILRSLSGLEPR